MLSHRDSMPLPSLSNQLPPQPGSWKPAGLFARLTNSASNQDNLSPVEQAVHWLIYSDAHFQHWAQIFQLADKLAASEAESKLAVRALKKAIKHAAPDIQARALRLTVVLALNSSDRFRLQIASKKFLDTVQDTFIKSGKHSNSTSNSHPNPYGLLREMILKGFSVLGFEFQHDSDLYVFTNFYNRIKSADAPLNGTPLSDAEGLFSPSSSVPPQPAAAAPMRSATASPLPPHPVHHQASHGQKPPGHYTHPYTQQPAVVPEMRDVRAEAEIARSNARLLIEALAFTVPSEMEDNEIIQEFHTKCLQNQSQLLDDIPWATAQAERARTSLQRHVPPIQASNRLSRTNPYGPEAGEGTREEHLLATLLAANSELVDAFKQFDELERLARNEREMRDVEERSRHDTRIARDAHGLLEVDAQLPNRASGSRSPVPRASGEAQRPQSGGSKEYHLSAADAGRPDERVVEGYNLSSREGEVEWPVGGHLTAEPERIEDRRSGESQVERSADEDVGAPVGPSAKALGKMRRISGRSERPVIGRSGGGDEEGEEAGEGSVLQEEEEEEEEWEAHRRGDVDEHGKPVRSL